MTTLEETDMDRPEEEEGSYSDRPEVRKVSGGTVSSTQLAKGKSSVMRHATLSPASLRGDAGRAGFSAWTFGQATKGEKDQQLNEQVWDEFPRRKSLEPTTARPLHDGRNWVESPMEMADRSRPW
jgi:hypothetical protein